MFNNNQPAILDWPVWKEWKQDCTHVDHNQFDTLYHLKSYAVHLSITELNLSGYLTGSERS